MSWIKEITLEVPSLSDNTADIDRLRRYLSKTLKWEGPIEIDLDLVTKIPDFFRQNDFKFECCMFRDRSKMVITGIRERGSSFLGVAVDLGTTTYVIRIIDLKSKETLLEHSFINPQEKIGADILTRIHFATNKGVKELQNLIVDDINIRLKEMCDSLNRSVKDVFNMAVAGNTTMTHLFLGIDPKWIIREPYIPAVNEIDLIKAKDINIDLSPNSRIFCFPNIGSYFGGDLIAGILYTGIHRKEEISILVDVGTNAEVVLGNKDWLVACAGAAGPALETGMSKIGKRAGPGIIDRIRYDPDKKRFEYHTIGDLPPVGICGSGVIDLAATMFRWGLIDFRGKFVPDKAPSLFKELDGIWHIVIVPSEESGTKEDLLISQPEIDSLIRSKAAMYTILETITSTVGITFEDIKNFYVGGTFGNYIDPKSAIFIGMLPDIPIERFKGMGNTSLEGATLILKEPDFMEEIWEIQKKITYIELNVNQDFMMKFSAAKFLPHTDKERFPSVMSFFKNT